MPSKTLDLMKNLFTDVIPITSLFKMGFHKNYPKAVVYGPVFKGGLNMVDLTIEEGARTSFITCIQKTRLHS